MENTQPRNEKLRILASVWLKEVIQLTEAVEPEVVLAKQESGL